jgi:integrase
MSKKVITFPKENKEITYKMLKQFRFGLRSHKMMYENGIIKEHIFIYLKHWSGAFVELTPYSRYLRYLKGKNVDTRKPSTLRKRGSLICMFLNYTLIDMYNAFGITDMKDIKLEHGNWFLQAYADGNIGNGKPICEESVERVVIEIAKFFQWIQDTHKKEARYIYKIKLLQQIERKTHDGTVYVTNDTAFNPVRISPNIEKKPLLRDIPTKVFQILLRLCAEHPKYQDIALALCFGAYCGLRPSEICNVRQHIDGGVSYSKNGYGEFRYFSIDLENPKNMRSDWVFVGGIKKLRKQKVYPKFMRTFKKYYDRHQERLKQKKIEKGFYPMFVNEQGKAMTSKDFRDKFKDLVHVHLVEEIRNSPDSELRSYAQILETYELSTHSLRHYFTVQLVLNGEGLFELMEWRGDSSEESSFTYIRDKSELMKLYGEANKSLVEDILNRIKKIKIDEE